MHEPHRSLIRVSTEFANGVKSYEQVLRECRSIYQNSTTYPVIIIVQNGWYEQRLLSSYTISFESAEI